MPRRPPLPARRRKELNDLEANPVDFCCGGPKGDDLLDWGTARRPRRTLAPSRDASRRARAVDRRPHQVLTGPDGTAYEGGAFQLDLKFPTEYPFKPPKIKFETKVYHPNIKTDTGEICNDVLVSNWSPTLNVRYVYTTLHELLKSPNVDHPLEPEIAQEFASDRATFDKKAKEMVDKHAR